MTVGRLFVEQPAVADRRYKVRLNLFAAMYKNTAKFHGFFYEGGGDADRRCEFVEKFIEKKTARIIDLGAGVGDIGLRLAEDGHYVFCFESNDALCAVLLNRFKARKELRHLVSIFPTTLEEFPVRLDADLVLASNVFSHLVSGEKSRLIHSVAGQLAAGGKFIFNCVQQTPLRPEQPLSEISKKVFGDTVIRHFASSKPVDGGKKQDVRFEYRMEFGGQPVGAFADDVTLYMDDPGAMGMALKDAGFHDVRIFGSYEGVPYDSDLPGFVVVASKAA